MNNDRLRFRVWDKKENFWLNEKITVITADDSTVYVVCSDGVKMYPNETIIQQCSGLKDSNGKLIFVGDVVKTYDMECTHPDFGEYDADEYIVIQEYDRLVLVEKKEGCRTSSYDYVWEEFEIIGNIMEDKELVGDE